MNSLNKLCIIITLLTAACFLNLHSVQAAQNGIAGFWHCEMTFGTLVKKYNVRFKQSDTMLTSQGYNDEVLSPYMFGSGSIEDSQVLVSEVGHQIYKHDWTAVYDGETITGTVLTQNVFNFVGTADISCRRAPEKDLGTNWRCEGPKVFYKNKAISRKNANALIQQQINKLRSGKKDKAKKTALKTLKKVINRCGGA